MKIFKTLFIFALISAIIAINVIVANNTKPWVLFLRDHRILFFSIEAGIILVYTHIKSYLIGKKRYIKKGQKNKLIKEAQEHNDIKKV